LFTSVAKCVLCYKYEIICHRQDRKALFCFIIDHKSAFVCVKNNISVEKSFLPQQTVDSAKAGSFPKDGLSPAYLPFTVLN
jgi:hypothetical protein